MFGVRKRRRPFIPSPLLVNNNNKVMEFFGLFYQENWTKIKSRVLMDVFACCCRGVTKRKNRIKKGRNRNNNKKKGKKSNGSE
jgi:hypothetical protein